MIGSNPINGPARQRGVSLIVVLVLMLLASLVLITSTRRAWLNDKVVGADADHQRAFAAAEALLRDAELDILGIRADGTACPVNPDPAVCRSRNNGMGFFPIEDDDLDLLQAVIQSQGVQCVVGLCLPANADDMQQALGDPARLAQLQAIGATYGRFTGAHAAASGNPLLIGAPARGWYWIETFRYSRAGAIRSGTQGLSLPDPAQPYIYRINVVVQGLRPGTQVRMRSVFIPRPAL